MHSHSMRLAGLVSMYYAYKVRQSIIILAYSRFCFYSQFDTLQNEYQTRFRALPTVTETELNNLLTVIVQ